MKTFKRTLAIMITCVMALTFCLATALTAFAEDPDPSTPTPTPTTYSIKVENAGTHTYAAYQIFSGEVAGADQLSKIGWGVNIDSVKLINLLKADDTFKAEGTNPFAKDGITAEEVATIIAGYKDAKADLAIAFAKIAGKCVKTTPAPKTATGANDVATITGLEAGYYIIKDETELAAGDMPDAISLNLLKVAGNVTVTSKNDAPTLDKEIVEPNILDAPTNSKNTASIGDTVKFKLTSKVPDMTGYDKKYFFVITDKLSEGLTFKNDVQITIAGVTPSPLTSDYYTVNIVDGGFEIVFKNFIQWKDKKGAAITVTYSAVLNENADLTQKGNTNVANLEYSNDPNEEQKSWNPPTNPDDPEYPDYPENPGDPDPDKPAPKTPTGTTPDAKTVTYSTKIVITKRGGSATGDLLQGAEFQLTGESLVATVVTQGVAVKAANGTYYLLKDGTYTTEAPDGNEDAYVSTTEKYNIVESTDPSYSTIVKINARATTDASGNITFEGLGVGTYYITEITAPNGYNLLKDPIVIVISATASATGCTWSATQDGEDITVVQGTETEESSIPVTIINNKGPQLPTTGGIGTKMFYLIGGLLAAGSAIFLITRKRMSVKEN